MSQSNVLLGGGGVCLYLIDSEPKTPVLVWRRVKVFQEEALGPSLLELIRRAKDFIFAFASQRIGQLVAGPSGRFPVEWHRSRKRYDGARESCFEDLNPGGFVRYWLSTQGGGRQRQDESCNKAVRLRQIVNSIGVQQRDKLAQVLVQWHRGGGGRGGPSQSSDVRRGSGAHRQGRRLGQPPPESRRRGLLSPPFHYPPERAQFSPSDYQGNCRLVYLRPISAACWLAGPTITPSLIMSMTLLAFIEFRKKT
jgi:hypothetical protein